MLECVFCNIVSGKSPAYIIWEGKNHIAFLSIFPNTEGATVVIPKKHYPSYVFDLPDDIISELVIAVKSVANLLDTKLEDVGRTAMVFEGFGIDHVHAKLFPMHGTRMKHWEPINSLQDRYFAKYEGYISSHDYKGISSEKLIETAKKIKK